MLLIVHRINRVLHIRTNHEIIDSLLDEVRLVLVILFAELDHIAHRFWLPVREVAVDVGYACVVRWRWHRLLDHIELFRVMLDHFFVLLCGKHTDSWSPDKDSHDVAAADPAVILRARADLPLCLAWHYLFVAELSLD